MLIFLSKYLDVSEEKKIQYLDYLRCMIVEVLKENIGNMEWNNYQKLGNFNFQVLPFQHNV